MASSALDAGRAWRAAAMGGLAAILALAPQARSEDQVSSQDTGAIFNPAARPEYREPVTLASKDGVLEVTLKAHQGHATLDTVAKPVANALVFGYQLVRGTASDGQ